MRTMTKWLRKIILFPLCVIMAVDPPPVADPPPVVDPPVIDPPPVVDPPSVDLSTLFTPEEVTAKQEAIEAAKGEDIRRAALTDEERATEDAAAEAKKASEGAPESYADFTVPENLTVDTVMLDKFKPLAKEMNLNQEQAQKLVDIAAEMTAGHYANQAEVWQTTQQEWQTAAKADKEYGGDKFDENLDAARRVINTFGTPELKSFLDEYGLGNHPEAVRLFVRISKSLKEDSLEHGKEVTAKKGDIASRLYPNLPKG